MKSAAVLLGPPVGAFCKSVMAAGYWPNVVEYSMQARFSIFRVPSAEPSRWALPARRRLGTVIATMIRIIEPIMPILIVGKLALEMRILCSPEKDQLRDRNFLEKEYVAGHVRDIEH